MGEVHGIGDSVRRLGKILVSGILFTLLGLGGLVVSLLIIPALQILPGGPGIRQRRARWLIHHLFRSFVFALQGSGILRLETAGFPEPATLRGKLILANHPGYLDVVLIISLMRDAVCVVKEGVWNNWFFGKIIREAGYIRNLNPQDCLRDATEALRRGDPMIIFPEGTRTTLGSPMTFRRGAAHLALASGAEILPLVVTCEPPLLEKGSRWYHIPIRTCQYRVCAQSPIPTPLDSLGGMPPILAARRFSKMLEEHFNRARLDPNPEPIR